jgi:Arc/MetJ-type ribon-helix-helix transcriptional regulator
MAKLKRKRDEKKIRVTIDLTEHSYARLQRLEEMTEVSSKADVIRQALRLLEFVAEKKAEGLEFYMKGKDKSSVMVPLLGFAA